MPITPKLFVTGASGQLGMLVIDTLLETVPANAIVAGMRDPAKNDGTANALREKGVEVRTADYTRPETLTSALAGIDRLLLISSSENGKRKVHHRNVINAAKNAGVGLIAYTSILHADTSPLFLAEEHRDTEAALTEAGVPFVFLRNGWYTEVYTWRLPLALKHNVFMGAAGEGRISSAARADYARAAATVLAGDDHAGRIYELAGDASFTLAELVAVVAEASGKPMTYQNMTQEEFKSAALKAGLPEMVARILSDTDAGVAKGALFDNGGALARLIGRPTTPFRTTITGFVQNQNSPSHAPSNSI
jgi:NAD(P)H dehydrogenase (quinone)